MQPYDAVGLGVIGILLFIVLVVLFVAMAISMAIIALIEQVKK